MILATRKQMIVLKACSMARHGTTNFNNTYEIIKFNKIEFSKKDNIYKIARMTGNRYNILGISFANKASIENNIEIIEWNFPKIDNSKIRTSKKEILDQVLSALNSINQALGTNYTLSKIYYVPSEDGSSKIYQTLIRSLIKYYCENKEFKEV